jgi:hypothetical protein
MQAEVIALLFPDPGQTRDGASQLVTALVRDAQGLMELRTVKPDGPMLGRARVAGRFNTGKPILDPVTREVIGYEIAALPMAAG